MKTQDAWADLITALTILQKARTSDNTPFHCEHDTLWVLADPSKLSAEEIQQLDKLGFFVSEEDECFQSFRYGSA